MPVFSIVIPVFNQPRELELTLYALQLQQFEDCAYEVIVVDDGSTAAMASRIASFCEHFRFILVRAPERRGRAAARNLGASSAQGLYMIFLDADYLVKRDFLSTLYESFSREVNDNKVVSNFPYSDKHVFTTWHPDFEAYQTEMFKELAVAASKEAQLSSGEVTPLFTMEELKQDDYEARLEAISTWGGLKEEELLAGSRTDVAPWTTFVTRCVALKRRTFEQLGGFDEQFVKYGMEDWELGYRLYKAGIPFETITRNLGYHQEHPVYHRGEDTKGENLRYFLRKHGTNELETGLLLVSPPWLQWMHGYITFKSLLRALQGAVQAGGMEEQLQLLRESVAARAEAFLMEG